MPHSPLSKRLMDILLYQGRNRDSEVRALSLAALNDDNLMAVTCLFWTQLGWCWGLAASGWLWIFGFVIADICLFILRWRMRNNCGIEAGEVRLDPLWQRWAAPSHIGFIALLSIDIFFLTIIPAERAVGLAFILSIGFCGYVTAMLTAFPILAGLNIVMLIGALELGLIASGSFLFWPYTVILPVVAIAFIILMRRTHEVLLGSIRAQQMNRLLSLHDPLTKLPNRAFMRDTLARHLAAIGTPEGPASVAVLCCDLDGFKTVNDRFGHGTGDWVLIHVADILRDRLMPGESVCRIGGDEFVLILPGGNEARVCALSREVIETLSKPLDVGHMIPARIGISFGVAITSEPGRKLDGLLEQADGALYKAKQAGRGQLRMHGEGLSSHRQTCSPLDATVMLERA